MNQRTRQFCTFYVDSLFLGIDVQQIQEVIRCQGMTRVPLAATAISGLITSIALTGKDDFIEKIRNA